MPPRFHTQVEDMIDKLVTFARVQLIQKIKDGVSKVINKLMNKVWHNVASCQNTTFVPGLSLHVALSENT